MIKSECHPSPHKQAIFEYWQKIDLAYYVTSSAPRSSPPNPPITPLTIDQKPRDNISADDGCPRNLCDTMNGRRKGWVDKLYGYEEIPIYVLAWTFFSEAVWAFNDDIFFKD